MDKSTPQLLLNHQNTLQRISTIALEHSQPPHYATQIELDRLNTSLLILTFKQPTIPIDFEVVSTVLLPFAELKQVILFEEDNMKRALVEMPDSASTVAASRSLNEVAFDTFFILTVKLGGNLTLHHNKDSSSDEESAPSLPKQMPHSFPQPDHVHQHHQGGSSGIRSGQMPPERSLSLTIAEPESINHHVIQSSQSHSEHLFTESTMQSSQVGMQSKVYSPFRRANQTSTSLMDFNPPSNFVTTEPQTGPHTHGAFTQLGPGPGGPFRPPLLMSQGPPGAISLLNNPYSLTSVSANSLDSDGGIGGPGPAGSGSGGSGGNGGGNNQDSRVLIVRNLPEKTHPDTIFRLFGVYGNVVCVKILHKDPRKALVEFQTSFQALLAKINLNNVEFLGQNLLVDSSKIGSLFKNEDLKGFTKDYSGSKEHRYVHSGSKNFKNIVPPSNVLHISNISENIELQSVVSILSNAGKIESFKYFDKDKRMALLRIASVSDAVNILVHYHNYDIGGRLLKISFSKNQFK
eukprot:TRINITY_DN5158_c0_g1_i1.p1 TRINITY_DN5158_c0_g1~~TRINITY_DN5158_c0_g1_i1.p1  ORF type:complete len:519 (-),score=101.05 TRINITY_DN5158_c0_g1_i1:233-1789(-)